MLLDRLRAQVQLRRRLLVRRAPRNHERDLQLLRRQLRRIRIAPAANPLARRAQFRCGVLGPRSGTQPLERLECRVQHDSRVDPAPGPAQPLAERELGPRLRERPPGLLVQAERFPECVLLRLEDRPEVRRRSDPDTSQLTPQELQVALVVARGATNKEAAAQLYLSPKTIEKHLGSVYTKLGLRSRTELAGVLGTLSPADVVAVV